MSEEFTYDVFLSHSAKDKAVIRALAERLRKDGLKIWFDEWAIKAGDNIPAKIEEGLERSRVLVLCMSAHAFASDWAQLESQTFRFRDPLNKQRRFIPLRLDDAPIKGSLAQFRNIRWRDTVDNQAYDELFVACGGSGTTFSSVPIPEAISVSQPVSTTRSTGGDDYLRRRRDIIQQVFSAFEPIHAFFFKVCLDYSSLVELLHAGIPASRTDIDRYQIYINEIGRMLHDVHLLEGRLRVASAEGSVAAMQQYRLQATEVNDMLQLQTPKFTKDQVIQITEELFNRKDRLYAQIAGALKGVAPSVAKQAPARPRIRMRKPWVQRWKDY